MPISSQNKRAKIRRQIRKLEQFTNNGSHSRSFWTVRDSIIYSTNEHNRMVKYAVLWYPNQQFILLPRILVCWQQQVLNDGIHCKKKESQLKYQRYGWRIPFTIWKSQWSERGEITYKMSLRSILWYQHPPPNFMKILPNHGGWNRKIEDAWRKTPLPASKSCG